MNSYATDTGAGVPRPSGVGVLNRRGLRVLGRLSGLGWRNGRARTWYCSSARWWKQAAMGALHGIAQFALVAAFLLASAAMAGAQTYSVLYTFTGGADGEYPQAPMTLDAATGTLYGATGSGGSGGSGTVFELTPAGAESVLHSFTGSPDGAGPIDMFLDPKGNLFGTTLGGGAYGGGTVFKIAPNGAETVLHSFEAAPDGKDGKEPSSGLIRDPNTGNFYGVTVGGGPDGVGTLYKIRASGGERVLYSFASQGDQPAGTLVRDPKTGNLYGLLQLGGLPWGCGGVFRFTPAGVETTLYLFTGQLGDGCEPGPYDPGLVMDAHGNLFGTTWFGGIAGQGVVFELTAGGVEKVIHKFKGAKYGDGAWPLAGLVLDASTGNLYGITEIGGTGGDCGSGNPGCGTIFKLSPPTTKYGRWSETILHSFTGGADGSYPSAGLARDPQTGNLYGTVVAGGIYNKGLLFKLTP